MRIAILLVALCVLSGSAWAQREPCSGSRGGVVMCDGSAFICADGAVSKSTKNCQATDYAKKAAVDVGGVDKKPEKASSKVGGWIVVAVLGFILWFVGSVVWFVVRRAWRYFRKDRDQASTA